MVRSECFQTTRNGNARRVAVRSIAWLDLWVSNGRKDLVIMEKRGFVVRQPSLDAIVAVKMDAHTTIAPTLPIPKLTMVWGGLLVGLRRAEQGDNFLLAHARSNSHESVERDTMRRKVGGQRRPDRSASDEDCYENHDLMSSLRCHTAPCWGLTTIRRNKVSYISALVEGSVRAKGKHGPAISKIARGYNRRLELRTAG